MRVLYTLAGLILSTASTSAIAQSLAGGAAPPVRIEDRNGVDLISGQITRPATSFGIGLAEHPTFSMNMSAGGYVVPGGTPDFQSRVFMEPCVVDPQHPIACSQSIYVDYEDQIEKFSNVTKLGNLGGSFVRTSTEYVITRADGSVWHFPLIGQSTSAATNWTWGYISKIEEPDGTILTYIPGKVISNDGYAMTFGGPGFPSTFINTTIDPCDTNGCSNFSYDWKGITFSSSGTNYQYKDAVGNVATLSVSSNGDTNGLSTYDSASAAGVHFHWKTAAWYGGSVAGVRPATTGISYLSGPYGDYSYTYTVNTYSQIDTAQSTDALSGKILMSRSGDFNYKVTDQNNHTTTYNAAIWSFDNSYRPTPLLLNQALYPEGNLVTYVRDSRQNVIEVDVDSNDQKFKKSTASFDTTCLNYKTCNKPNYIIDFNGNRTDYTYDTNSGFVLTKTMPADKNGVRSKITYNYTQLSSHYKSTSGGTITGAPIWRLLYSSTCQTNPNCTGTSDEVITSYTYNENLLPVTETVKLGDGTVLSVTAKAYDAVGNVISIDGPLPGTADTTRYVYDDDRRLVATMSPNPGGPGGLKVRVTKTAYNGDGQVIEVDEGAAADQTDGSLTGMAVIRKTLTTYDAYGRKVTDAVADGTATQALTQYDYDALGRLRCAAVRMNPDPTVYGSLPASACTPSKAGSFGSDRITQNVYDAAGQRLQLMKGVGVMGPGGVGIPDRTNTYSANGKVLTTADANGNVTAYQYDGYDRLYKTIYPTPGSGTTPSTTDYEQLTYDANDNITQRRQRDGQLINYTYDALNRQILIDLPGTSGNLNPDVSYNYDLQGHVLSATDTAGGSVLYGYNGLGQMTSENEGGRIYASLYDAAGRRMKFTWPDGTFMTYDYLVTGEMWKIHENGAVASLVEFGYDDLGQRKSLIRANGVTTNYVHDGLSRLTSLSYDLPGAAGYQKYMLDYNPASQIVHSTRSNDSFAYGGAFNANVIYKTNSLNQYTTVQSANTGVYSYDGRGNVIGTGSATYGYDARNLLMSSSAGNSSFTYDPTSRMRTIAAEGVVLDYDGPNLVAEYSNSGSLLRRYVHGPDSDDPLIWYEGTTKQWLLADNQGSIVAVTDTSGNVQHINSYDEYGLPGLNNAGRFQYTGQAWIAGVGLYNYKARLYSPGLGRFMQTDPTGYKDGLNWYAYVANDPVNGVDPSGTTCQKSGGGAYNCQIDKVQTTVNGKEVTRNATAADHKQYAGVEKSLTNAVNAAAAKGGKMENISFKAGGKSYSFSISSGQIAQNLAARIMVADPSGIVGAMNTPSNRLTNIESRGINPGGYTRYGDESRTRSMEFLHEGIHGSREEARGLGPDLGRLGANPFKDAHQDSYDNAADDILGPQ